MSHCLSELNWWLGSSKCFVSKEGVSFVEHDVMTCGPIISGALISFGAAASCMPMERSCLSPSLCDRTWETSWKGRCGT
jgi:hypothetical protein